jgi:hypothetical protein
MTTRLPEPQVRAVEFPVPDVVASSRIGAFAQI